MFGLGSFRLLALNRLYNLEHCLNKDPDLYNAYRIFMDEYIALGHMILANVMENILSHIIQ